MEQRCRMIASGRNKARLWRWALGPYNQDFRDRRASAVVLHPAAQRPQPCRVADRRQSEEPLLGSAHGKWSLRVAQRRQQSPAGQTEESCSPAYQHRYDPQL